MKLVNAFKRNTFLIKHNASSLKINWGTDDSFVFIAVAILSKLDLVTHYEEKAFNEKHEFHFKLLKKREFALLSHVWQATSKTNFIGHFARKS